MRGDPECVSSTNVRFRQYFSLLAWWFLIGCEIMLKIINNVDFIIEYN